MSLSKKVIVQTVFVISLVLTITFTSIAFLINRSFRSIEVNQAVTNSERARQALENSAKNLHSKAADWSSWDDAYKFVTTRNQDFIDTNLTPVTFNSTGVNGIFFFSDRQEVISAHFVDSDSQTYNPISATIASDLQKTYSKTLSDTNFNGSYGLIKSGENIYLTSVRPISDTVNSQTPTGKLVMIIKVDDRLLQNLSNLSQNQISLSPHRTQDAHVQFTDSNTLISRETLADLSNQALIDLVVTAPRPIYQAYIQTIQAYIITIILTLVSLIGSLIYSIQRSVLLPLKKFIQQINHLSETEELNQNLPDPGIVEFSRLAQVINILISRLSQSQTSLTDKIVQSENTAKAMINILEDERELETKLKIERDQISTIVNSMGEALLVIDRNYQITLMNSAAEKLLETDQKSAIGKNWSSLVTTVKGDIKTPTEERSFAQVISSATSIVTRLEDDHYYQTKSGKTFPVVSTTAPVINHAGVVVGAVKVFKDASAEKEAAKIIEHTVAERTRELREKNQALIAAKHQISQGWLEVQEEKARLTASINNLPLGFIILDKNEQIIIANDSARQLLNLESPPESFAQIKSIFADTIDIHQLHIECLSSKLPLGSKEVLLGPKYLHLFIAPIILDNPHKDCIGTALLIEDVTNAKALERSKEEFFSIASHELRTPLTAIMGNSSMMLEYYRDKLPDSQFSEMLDDIRSASVRLIGIVNDFLETSRLEQGRINFKMEAFNLNTAVEEIVGELRTSYQKSAVPINFVASPDLPLAYADKDRTKQIITNLVGNAVKFTDAGSISISVSQLESKLQVTVSDTGRGVPLAQQHLLFRKFQQAGESLYVRDTTKGTGLGLYISKLMVEGMGGNIKLVESIPGKGSTFAFTLPVANSS